MRRGTDERVPSCPDWTVADLAVHLGTVHRWAAETVRSRANERVGGRGERFQTDPTDPRLAEWVEEGAAELVRVLDESGPDRPVWTFGEPPTTTFWFRRQAQETAVHRWDAECAHGQPQPIEPELAADGIAENLEVFLPRRAQAAQEKGDGGSFHFHRTDGDGEWFVRFGSEGVTVERTHAKGDVAVRGPASGLLLFLWGRVPADDLEVFGDPALLDRWFELLPPV